MNIRLLAMTVLFVPATLNAADAADDAMNALEAKSEKSGESTAPERSPDKSSTTPVTATLPAVSEVISGAVSFEFLHSDRKVQESVDADSNGKTDGIASVASIGVRRAAVSVSRIVTPAIDYRITFDVMKLGDEFVEEAFLHWTPTNLINLHLGKTRTLQAVFSGAEEEFRNVWGTSPYVRPFTDYSEGLRLNANVAGTMTIQLVNDVLVPTTPSQQPLDRQVGVGRWNARARQPAVILQYLGLFGPIEPLIQYGRYDMNHSNFYGFGIKSRMGGVMDVVLDYFADNESHKVSEEGVDKDRFVTYATTTLRLEYLFPNLARPFVWYSTFNRTDKDLATPDADGVKHEVDMNSPGVFDDNSSQISVGSYILAAADGLFEPYVAFRYQAGKFSDVENPSERKTYSQSNIAIGACGKF